MNKIYAGIIALGLFIGSMLLGAAWVYTEPDSPVFNYSTGIMMGNSSFNATNIVSDGFTTTRGKVLDNPELGASYVIFNDSGIIYAKNTSTGKIDFSGTNASVLIQNVLDTMENNGGGHAVIREGTYMIGATITPRNRSWLSGVGEATILKRISSAGLISHRMFYAPSSNNLEYFRLSHMTIDANEDPSDYDEGSVCIYMCGDHLYAHDLRILNTVKALTLLDGADFNVHDVSIETIHKTYADGIAFNDCVGGNIENCYVESYDDCVVLNGCSFVNVNNIVCAGSGNLNPAIKLRGNQLNNDLHNININNVVINERDWGLYFWISDNVCEIYNINIQNIVMNDITNKCILFRNDLSATSPNLIHDISFDNIRCENAKYGICIWNRTATDLTFSNVMINDTDVYSVYIESGENIRFSDCVFSNVTGDYYGIYLNGTSAGIGGIDNIVFDGIVSKHHGKDGFYSVEVNGSVRIYDSEFSYNGRDGLRVGGNHSVFNCDIRNNAEYGLRYHDTLSEKTIVEGCRFEDNVLGDIIPSTGIAVTKNNYGVAPYDWGKKSSAPTPFGEGDSYYNTNDHVKYVYNGTAWKALW